MMKTVEAKCKFCGKPISLSFDEEYTNDVYKLTEKAACNRCGDFVRKRRDVMNNIKDICIALDTSRDPDLVMVRKSLTILCKRYLQLLAGYKEATEPEWDENIVEALMSKPRGYPEVIKNMDGLIKQPTLI